MANFRSSKKIRPSKLSIDSKIFNKVKGRTEKDVENRILLELKKFDFYNAKRLIFELGASKKIPKSLTNIFDISNHYRHGHITNKISAENHIYWLLGILMANTDLLKRFNECRQSLNCKILKGDAASALSKLDEVDTLSLSWWSTEIRLHIIKELQKKDTKELLQQFTNSLPGIDYSGWTFDLSLISESNSIDVYVNIIISRLREIRTSGVESAIAAGAVNSCTALPISYDVNRKLSLTSTYFYRHESIIDQYVLLKKIVGEISAEEQEIPSDIYGYLISLAKHVNDIELINFLAPSDLPDSFIGSVLDDYTKGKYQDVISKINDSIVREIPNTFGLIELYARSIVYAPTARRNTSFFDMLAAELCQILQLAPKSIEKISYLKKICIKFRTESWAKSLIFHIHKAIEEIEPVGVVEAARLQTLCLGNLGTPKSREKEYALKIRDLFFGHSIAPQRVLRYSAAEDTSKPLEEEFFTIYSDYLRAKSRHLLDQNLLIDAIEFSVNEYLKNKMAYIFLPIRKLCELIEDIPSEENQNHLCCLILLDIYSREFDSAYDEIKIDLFEEYLRHEDTHQPSSIFKASEISPYAAYFLRHICIPSMLDNIIAFKSYDEVIHERIAIIDILINSKPSDIEDLRRDKDNVLENLFSEKLRAKIESGKLFVDTQALEQQRKHIYVGLFEQAKTLEGGIVLDVIEESDSANESKDIFEISKDESGMPEAVPSSQKTDLLFKIFTTAATDFALNENYGLDKYLSAEVRHTVFLTQLRSCFEKSMLVTTKKNGEYQSNDFWRNEYNYVYAPIVDRIDELLKAYSKEVDDILTTTNNRFRVAVGRESDGNVFNFKAYHHRLVKISQIIDASSTFDSFFSSLLKYMWSIAGECAGNAQRLINEELKHAILDRTLTLEHEIQNAKGEVAMVDLMHEIKNARTNFIKEIELVLNWFRFVGADDLGDLERLGVVIEASVSSFDSIYGHIDRALVFTQSKSQLQLTYREARALFISLFTALDNAFKYSSNSTPIALSHTSYPEHDSILITNSPASPFENPEHFANLERSKWTEENSNLNTKEGGSGLYKIHSLLTSASSGFEFDIEVERQKFTTIIRLKHEYFSDRG